MSQSEFLSFTTKLAFNMGQVFDNEILDVTIHFDLLPSRNSVITAVAFRQDGTLTHLSGLSSKFGENTDLFLKNNEVSIIASLQTDSNGKITGGKSSGYISQSGWTRFWWTEEVKPVA